MSETQTTALEITCTGCGKAHKVTPTKKGVRIPKAWHRLLDEVLCPDCWGKRYKLRAVTFAVAGPLDGTWPDLRAAMRGAWGRSTALANWAVTELAKADRVRAATDAKLPPMPKVDLYKLWQAHWQRSEWDGSAQSANAVLHAVEAKYRRRRRDVIWTGESSLPSYRYPYAYPVHNAAWEASYREWTGTDGHVSRVPAVSVPIGNTRWTLRLAGGAERFRQLRAFAKIVSGAAVQGELALYRQRTFGGGNGGRESNGAAGQQFRTRIMCKLVAWLPRDETDRAKKGALSVTTTNNSFLVALMEGDEQPWRVHADDVRGVIKAHRKRLDRMADDTKAERRKPPRQAARYRAKLAEISRRANNRIDSFVKESASWTVAYAVRRGAEALTYDDAKRGYFPSFPWAAFRDRLAAKCDEAGIVFVHVAASAAEETAEETTES